MPKTSRGFTLIELLITISIIAILSAIGMIAYSTVLKQGRDSKRQADLRTIQSALEQYHSDKGYYPANYKILSPTTGRKYLTTIPQDPNKSEETVIHNGVNLGQFPVQIYQYREVPRDCNNSSIFCTSYRLCALFEIPTTNTGSCIPENVTDPAIKCTRNDFCNGGVSPP